MALEYVFKTHRKAAQELLFYLFRVARVRLESPGMCQHCRHDSSIKKSARCFIHRK